MDRSSQIIKTSWIGIIANVLLAAFKAVVGLLASSVAIIMDAVNNLSDALSSVITIVGTKLSQRPADRKHPFGFGRIEQVHGFYYFEDERRVSVDIVPDLTINDDTAFIQELTAELQPLIPHDHLTIVIDHNYSE